ncbi:sphingoid long-chain base transporter RSB1, partial [Lophium mytilinum]
MANASMPLECTEITPQCPANGSGLSYPPNVAASIISLYIFALSVPAHVFLGWKHKTWTFMAAMLLGSSFEVTGYLGRALLHSNPYKLITFLIQIVTLTQGPSFYSAGIYLCLSRLVVVYGVTLSRVKSITYTRVFIFFDLICLCLQGGGGGVASSADNNQSMMDLGNKLMLVGLILQIVFMLFFAICCLEYFWRVRKNPSRKNPQFAKLRASSKFKGFLVALFGCYCAIFTRCVYRVVELGGGWDNALMRKEVPFIISESSMMVIAAWILIAFHPGPCFQGAFNLQNY